MERIVRVADATDTGRLTSQPALQAQQVAPPVSATTSTRAANEDRVGTRRRLGIREIARNKSRLGIGETLGTRAD